MFKLNFKISLVLLSFTCSSLSYGAILIEPHIGYNLKGSADYKSGTVTMPGGVTGAVGSFKNEYSGLQYGGRIGLQYTPGLMFGLDYRKSIYDIKTTYGNGDPAEKDSYERSEMGAFVGASLPMALRLWFGYYIAKETASKSNSETDVEKGDFNKGNSYEIGVGYAPFRFMSLNLLYRGFSYDDGEYANGDKYSLSPAYKANEIVLGVSFPLTL